MKQEQHRTVSPEDWTPGLGVGGLCRRGRSVRYDCQLPPPDGLPRTWGFTCIVSWFCYWLRTGLVVVPPFSLVNTGRLQSLRLSVPPDPPRRLEMECFSFIIEWMNYNVSLHMLSNKKCINWIKIMLDFDGSRTIILNLTEDQIIAYVVKARTNDTVSFSHFAINNVARGICTCYNGKKILNKSFSSLFRSFQL